MLCFECNICIVIVVDCIWGEWFLGECSAECGGGIELDFRHKIQEELFGGKPCEGEHIRHEDCNTHNCPSMTLYRLYQSLYRNNHQLDK